MDLARVYTRGKVVPSQKFLKDNGLILTEDGKLVYEKDLGSVDPNLLVEGEVCVLEESESSNEIHVPLDPRRFPNWFRFGDCGNKEACIVTIQAKVQFNRNDCT